MIANFVYSFDRESFMGRFATRSEALQAALKHAAAYPSPINTVYVGQQVMPNLHTFGHARRVIDAMRRSVRDSVGDAADEYLRRVPDAQVMDLDKALETTIVAWLERQNLVPSFTEVQAISEHVVPLGETSGLDENPQDFDKEVHDLGQSRDFNG